MTVAIDTAPPATRAARRSMLGWVLPLAVLALALGVRVPHLARHGYDLDEMWTAEVSVGRGSPHVTLPTGRLLFPAPELTRLTADAPPAWDVWTHMDITHPPLYQVLLRLWLDVAGTGDAAGRALSVVASAVAVLLLYDTVRLRSGRWPAFWAAALMAASAPQVEYARMTRGYALLAAVALAAADAATRIEVLGPSRRRATALAAAVAATLLTHYFAAATVAALAVYAAACLRGPARRAVGVGVGIGVAAFALSWLPLVPGQMHLFHADDPATDFLRHDTPHHVAQTFLRAALVPLSMLFAPTSGSVAVAAGGAVLYALPLALARRAPGLAFWGLWLWGTVGLLVGLDLARGTTHLFYVRYVLLAGPAVFALVPTLLAALAGGQGSPLRWVAHAVPAVAVGASLLALPYDVYAPRRADPREVTAVIAPRLSPADLLVFTTKPEDAQFAGSLYLLLDRYLGPVPCPLVLLTGPASPAVMDRLRHSRQVWMLTDVGDWRPYLPGVDAAGPSRMFPGIGVLWQLR
jgi:hypothetical protein